MYSTAYAEDEEQEVEEEHGNEEKGEGSVHCPASSMSSRRGSSSTA